MRKILKIVLNCIVVCGCIITGFNVFAYPEDDEIVQNSQQRQSSCEDDRCWLTLEICKMAASVGENDMSRALGMACEIFENLMGFYNRMQLSEDETHRFVSGKLNLFNRKLEAVKQEDRENLIVNMLQNSRKLNSENVPNQVKLNK